MKLSANEKVYSIEKNEFGYEMLHDYVQHVLNSYSESLVVLQNGSHLHPNALKTGNWHCESFQPREGFDIEDCPLITVYFNKDVINSVEWAFIRAVLSEDGVFYDVELLDDEGNQLDEYRCVFVPSCYDFVYHMEYTVYNRILEDGENDFEHSYVVIPTEFDVDMLKKSEPETKTEIYGIYSQESDITFFMKDTIVNGELKSVESMGFVFGMVDNSEIAELVTDERNCTHKAELN